MFCFSLSEIHLRCNKHVEAEDGKSVVLPCITEPQLDLKMVHWTRKEKGKDQDVHVYRDNEDDFEGQNLHFKSRTSLFNSQISKGICSLKLSNTSKTDSGTYECIVDFSNNNANLLNAQLPLVVSRQSLL